MEGNKRENVEVNNNKNNNKKLDNKPIKSSLDSEFSQSKTAQGILFAFLLLIFSPIYGIVKYPKGTQARKTYMRANIITLVVLIVLIAVVSVVCVVIINLVVEITEGTANAIIGSL